MINDTAVALCVCVSVSSLMFSLSGKKEQLSVCRVSDSLVEAKACRACMCGVGHMRSLPESPLVPRAW